MKMVTADILDSLVEFDTPFNLSPDHEYNETTHFYDERAMFRDSLDYARGYDLGHAPSVYVDAEVDEYGDAHVTGDAWIDQPMKMFKERWSFYSRGYTGQYGAKPTDPVMHASESVSGGLARDMITEGGTFAVVMVCMVTDSEEYDDANDDDLVGWVVLRRDS